MRCQKSVLYLYHASWGADITERIQKEDYPFFEKEMADALKNMDTKDDRSVLL